MREYFSRFVCCLWTDEWELSRLNAASIPRFKVIVFFFVLTCRNDVWGKCIIVKDEKQLNTSSTSYLTGNIAYKYSSVTFYTYVPNIDFYFFFYYIWHWLADIKFVQKILDLSLTVECSSYKKLFTCPVSLSITQKRTPIELTKIVTKYKKTTSSNELMMDKADRSWWIFSGYY